MLAKFDGLLKARKPQGDPTVLYISDAAVGEGFDMKDLFIRFKAELAKIGVHRIIPVELSFASPMMLTKLLKARKPHGDPTVLYISDAAAHLATRRPSFPTVLVCTVLDARAPAAASHSTSCPKE